jgi:hypothetical protein
VVRIAPLGPLGVILTQRWTSKNGPREENTRSSSRVTEILKCNFIPLDEASKLITFIKSLLSYKSGIA